MSGPPDDYRESGEALDFAGCDTFAKRVALAKRVFYRVMGDSRLDEFEPGLISADVPVSVAPGVPAIEGIPPPPPPPRVRPVVTDERLPTVVVPDPLPTLTEEGGKMDQYHPERFGTQLVFGVFGLEAFNLSVLVQGFGIGNGPGAIFLRIMRHNAVMNNMEVMSWADVDFFVDSFVDQARAFVHEIGHRVEASLQSVRRRVRSVLWNYGAWCSDIPRVTVPEYRNGFHLVSDVFCLGPPRFHVLSHDKRETMPGNQVAVVFSCPWLTPMILRGFGANTVERFVHDVQNRLLGGAVVDFVRAAVVEARVRNTYYTRAESPEPSDDDAGLVRRTRMRV